MENKVNSKLKNRGDITRIIKWKDGREEVINYANTVLRAGREALVSSLTNKYGDSYEFYINRMLFGDNGTSGGTPKYVTTNRTGLFGITRASKPVTSIIDPNLRSQATFMAILGFDDANGFALNEMALQMSNGDLYSMSTFADMNKTSQMQVTYLWRLNFI